MGRFLHLPALSLLLVGVLVACSSPNSPNQAPDLTPQAMGAVSGVAFQPPIGSSAVRDGKFDPSVTMSIEIFGFNTGSVESGAPLGPSFSTSDGTITVTNDPTVEEQYHANWHTSLTNVPDGTTLRAEIRLANAPANAPACTGNQANLTSGCLAFFDVTLYRNKGQAKKTEDSTGSSSATIALVNGQTLPIKLHVDKVAADVPPTVTITQPADNATFAPTDNITFNGTATDLEDGDLSSGIQWTSSLDGPLGTGATITHTLTAGTHTITSTATDSAGKTTSAYVTITVMSPGVYQIASLTTPRAQATATLLRDGRVLIAGGWDGTKALASAELFDPTTNTFSPTGSMNVARTNASAVLLPDGRVLIAGGTALTGCYTAISSMEVYDPSTGTFSMAPSMLTARYAFTAALLPDGNVLLAGGDGGCTAYAITSAEIFNPTTGGSVSIAPMTTARRDYRIVELQSGKYLIVGGYSGYAGISTAELFDPATNTFTPTGSMHYGRAGTSATLLQDGRVLVAGGGVNYNPYSTAELYNPTTGSFSLTGSMQNVRDGQGAALLSDGRVLAIGGRQQPNLINHAIASVEAYDPATGTFSPMSPLITPRFRPLTVTLDDGRILVAGGHGDYNGTTNPALASAEIIVP